MESIESKLKPLNQIDINQAVEGLYALGKVALAVTFLYIVAKKGLEKMTSSGKN